MLTKNEDLWAGLANGARGVSNDFDINLTHLSSLASTHAATTVARFVALSRCPLLRADWRAFAGLLCQTWGPLQVVTGFEARRDLRLKSTVLPIIQFILSDGIFDVGLV